MDKTLGQIAHEAAAKKFKWHLSWRDLRSPTRLQWEAIASAVAAAVKEEDARICEAVLEEIANGQHGLSYAAAIRASIKEGK